MSEELLDIYPTESMTPARVTEVQLLSMQQGNSRAFWRFVSPEGKSATGVLRPARYPYLVPPRYAELPVYAPLMFARRFEIIGGLPIAADRYQCRVRVWAACGGEPIPAPPIEYIWHLARQPLVRPVCYDYDPLQAGISAGPPFGGCWLVDDVRLDERRRGGDGGPARGSTPPKGGAERRVVVRRRTRALAMRSSDRPVLQALPAGVDSVDALTAELLRGLDSAELQAALEHLEVAIFESPPFEKENEVARRRNLALAYWLQDDPAYYPRLIPNAKEVLRQLKGNDAEMQCILGLSTLATMEGEPSTLRALRALERALELDPQCDAAREGLAAAKAALAAGDEPGAAPPPPVLPDAASATTEEAPVEEPVRQGGEAAAPPAGFEWGLML